MIGTGSPPEVAAKAGRDRGPRGCRKPRSDGSGPVVEAVAVLAARLGRSPTITDIGRLVGTCDEDVVQALDATVEAAHRDRHDRQHLDRALHLRFTESLGRCEIASRLGVSPVQVSCLLSVGLARMRERGSLE